MYVLSATGHRPDKLGGYHLLSDLAIELRGLVRARIRQLQVHDDLLVVSGLALGFDTIVAEEALALGVPLEAAVPFLGQEKRWPKEETGHAG